MTQYLGLSQKEAQKNRVEYGDNLLEGGQKKSAMKILLAQFGDLMTLILLCSTILSMVMGEKVEAMTIIAIVILNALMGFFRSIAPNVPCKSWVSWQLQVQRSFAMGTAE